MKCKGDWGRELARGGQQGSVGGGWVRSKHMYNDVRLISSLQDRISCHFKSQRGLGLHREKGAEGHTS